MRLIICMLLSIIIASHYYDYKLNLELKLSTASNKTNEKLSTVNYKKRKQENEAAKKL
jgi:hypothetical protein